MKQLSATVGIAASASFLPLTCQARADSLGMNKDCDAHPVSQLCAAISSKNGTKLKMTFVACLIMARFQRRL